MGIDVGSKSSLMALSVSVSACESSDAETEKSVCRPLGLAFRQDTHKTKGGTNASKHVAHAEPQGSQQPPEDLPDDSESNAAQQHQHRCNDNGCQQDHDRAIAYYWWIERLPVGG